MWSRISKLIAVSFLVLFICITPTHVLALSLTFVNASGTTPTEFTVYGDIFGSSNILESRPTNTLWNHLWEISDISDWAVLSPLTPDAYPNNETTWGQMFAGQGTNLGSLEYFRYHEDVSGYYPDTLELWGRDIDIRLAYSAIPAGATDFLGALNVVGAFTYAEGSSYATNFTFDGSTTANWVRERAEGTLTLVAYDLSAIPPSSVPEPSTMLLLGSGLLGLVGLNRRRKA